MLLAFGLQPDVNYHLACIYDGDKLCIHVNNTLAMVPRLLFPGTNLIATEHCNLIRTVHKAPASHFQTPILPGRWVPVKAWSSIGGEAPLTRFVLYIFPTISNRRRFVFTTPHNATVQDL